MFVRYFVVVLFVVLRCRVMRLCGILMGLRCGLVAIIWHFLSFGFYLGVTSSSNREVVLDLSVWPIPYHLYVSWVRRVISVTRHRLGNARKPKAPQP